MEKTRHAAVLPVAFDFSDLGTWEAVWRVSPRDAQGNLGPPDSYFADARDCLVRTETPLDVACIGVSNVAVIADGGSLLICDLGHSQAVKAAAGRFPPQGLTIVDRQTSLEAFAERYRHWLATAALPLWWSLGWDHGGAGFHDKIGLDGRAARGPRRARVQTRQAFVYANAHLRGHEGPWRDVAARGLEYFIDRYRRPDGLYRTLVDDDGAVLDDRPFLYDQAFALMAKATLYRCGAHPELRALALEQLAAIREAMTHPAGGFREAGDFPFQANAHMHLLEAALAWREADGDPIWTALADELGALALAHFIDPDSGALREFFSTDWTVAPGADGRLIEPGHQFEWAWLLERWMRATGRRDAAEAPQRLFMAGVRGLDLERAVAIDELNDDFSLRSSRARLWPQTEYIKAALLLAGGAPSEAKAAYLEHAKRGAGGLWRYLEVPTRGLWRDKQTPDGQFEAEPAPASSLYHIVGAVEALTDWLNA
ncbi:MAG: AGE family epimerase/isomerase [Caulobacteraceae bacterium]|nr:AGE family epimerase/isomerase [Caulobacteraceae bacterium]